MVNCGCATSHMTINSNGDIKLCTMDDSSCINIIGNVFKKSVEDTCKENFDLFKEIYKLVPPKKDSDDCINCNYRNFCNECILRAIICSKKVNNCGWFKTNISTDLINKLLK